MNFYTLTIYNGEEEIYAGIFSIFSNAASYADQHAERGVSFRQTPGVLDQWRDETETYYIDKVPEGYNIK